MKRTFLAKRNALLSPRGLSWGALALAFSLLVLFFRLVAPNIFLQVLTPVFQASSLIATESNAFFSSFGNAAVLADRNEKLARENAALVSENQALMKKADTLAALLGDTGKRGSAEGILASVVVRPPVGPYDTLLVSVGESDGVSVGMEAFGAGGVPVGIVSSVFSDFSRVTLFSTPSMSTDGWVGRANVPVTITGTGAGTMQASIARSSLVAVGDTVSIPGPGMLPLGSVVRIDSNPLSPGVTLRIRPAVNPFSISWITLRATGFASSVMATSTSL
jgi:cell shape-determining protein MreC